MNTGEIVAALDAEIERLRKAKELLTGPVERRSNGGRTMGAEARARIVADQKRRWAKVKREK